MEPQTHEELVAQTGQATQREIINKETGERYEVTSTSLGEDTVEFTSAIGVISFKNNKDNIFEDEIYLVQEV